MFQQMKQKLKILQFSQKFYSLLKKLFDYNRDIDFDFTNTEGSNDNNMLEHLETCFFVITQILNP